MLSSGSWLESKVSEGGTASARVDEQIDRARAVLARRGEWPMPKREPRMVPLGYGKFVQRRPGVRGRAARAGERGDGQAHLRPRGGPRPADRRLALGAGDPRPTWRLALTEAAGIPRRRRGEAAGRAVLGPARPSRLAARWPFFNRSVHRVARDLIGCTVAHGRDGGRDRRDRELPRRGPGLPRLRRPHATKRACCSARPHTHTCTSPTASTAC